jgi:hypothetical protein
MNEWLPELVNRCKNECFIDKWREWLIILEINGLLIGQRKYLRDVYMAELSAGWTDGYMKRKGVLINYWLYK